MRSRRFLVLAVAVAALLFATTSFAQSIVSARSGAIHHLEGRALIDGDVIATKFAEFPNLQESSVLRTERGRVEMLLTPGVVVRMSEHSALRMISSRLSDTRLELLEGSVLIEAMEILQDNAITLFCNDSSIQLLDEGLYRIDASPPQLRVFRGKAQVVSDDQILTAKKGKLVDLGGVLIATKFDSKAGDSLHRWSSRRSGYLAMANVSAARSLSNWGVPWSSSGWRWNQYFGMFTFVPYSGIYHSPFGYSYWSPRQVYQTYYVPRRQPASSGGWGGGASSRYNSNLGYVTVSSRSASRSSGSVSSGSSSASSSASSSPRTGGSSSSRGSAAGGRGR